MDTVEQSKRQMQPSPFKYLELELVTLTARDTSRPRIYGMYVDIWVGYDRRLHAHK